MTDYPAAWEADVVLRDGGTAHLRPIRAEDAEALVAMHSRLSDDTIYKRFFSPRPQLSQRDIQRFTTVDHVDRVALICTIGGAMVAVGRYDRGDDPDTAEVAFVVEDRHQGRGIGSVLLEHLAAAGRERGVRRFVADVLPGNRAMVRVFLDAGYEAHRSFEEGVVHLEFPIGETEQSTQVMQSREHRAEARSIERLLFPSSVAVVGASREARSVGRVVLDDILAAGFQGPVYPVHHEAPYVASIRAFPTVADIPDPVDLAVVATPAASVLDVVRQCADKGVRGLVVVSSGFAEAGEEGTAAQQEMVRLAREGGMRVIGPNCLGVINTDPAVSLNATLAPIAPGRGNVGFFCQSGALGIAILESVARRGLGLSTFVSAGNRADVSGNDLLQYWQDDPATEVVLLYLESFGNPRKFGRLARRVAREKPVVAVKSGRSLAGLPPGHAGHAVAVPDEAVDALFAQAGVIRVDTLAQLFDAAQVLAYQPLPAGRRVAVVGNSAALQVLAADSCESAGLEVTHTTDVGAAGSAEAFGRALSDALAADDVDAVITVFIPPLEVEQEAVGAALAAATEDATKPVVSTFLAFEGVPEQLRRASPEGVAMRGSVPSFRSPETAVLALARAAAYAEWRRRPIGTVPAFDDVDPDAARAVVETALGRAGGRAALSAEETLALLAAYGIEVLPAAPATTVEAAVAAAREVGYPVVLKAADESLRHRTDLGGVRLDLRSDDDVRSAYEAMSALSGGSVFVQRLAPAGVATVVTVTEDPSFGALVGFGLGGVAHDLLGDKAYRAVPLTDVDAAALVREPRTSPLLFGYRGAAAGDVAALEQLLARVGRLADDLPEVRAVELNPVLCAGQGLSVLHAEIAVEPQQDRMDTGPRRLRPIAREAPS